jgi:tetratricopeptide (TPR) repeat protein
LSRLLIIALLIPVVALAKVESEINIQGDTLHLELSGNAQWQYQLKKEAIKGSDYFKLVVDPLTEGARKKLSEFKNEIVQEITVTQNVSDGKDQISFKFKSGSTDAFDYLTDQPSRLIVDFFPAVKKANTTKAPASNAKKADSNPLPKKTPAVKTAANEKAKKDEAEDQDTNSASEEITAEFASSDQRKPATTDILTLGPQAAIESTVTEQTKRNVGILDGGDPNFERFSIQDYEIKEDSIIASQENVYLDFPTLRVSDKLLETILAKQPVYQIHPQDDEENKQARLLQTLYQNKRYNVFLKTVEWFMEKFPESKYDEMIRYMWADSHFAIWQESRNTNEFDLAMLRYRQVTDKYPNSNLVERTSMLMGFATYDRGDYLGALRLFQNHLKTKTNSPNAEIAKLAMAEALLKLNKYDESLRAYADVEKEARQDKHKIKATFSKGDVFYQKGDFEGAIQHYQEAIAKYPNELTNYPNALYNQGAAYFWLGKYKQSLGVYNEFLKKFSSHEYAGYALTRVGELLDILGADKSKVVGAYLETYFRYGETPGAVVARLRLLSSRMPTMKPKELERAVNDIESLAKDSTLSKIEQFAKVMIADGYAKRGDYQKSVGLMIKYYQANPTTADTQLLVNRIVKFINEDLRDRVRQGKFIDALKLHNQFATTWLKGANRMDTKYNVGKAFEQAGVYSEAESLFKDTLNKLYSIKGTQAEKERNVFEQLPATDEINLRLASVTYAQNKYTQAYEFLRAIKNPEKLSEADQVERVVIASDILEKRGDNQTALRYLTELVKTWSGVPKLVADPYFNLAKLEIKMNQKNEAIESLKKINQLMMDSGSVNEAVHADSLQKLSELYEEKGQFDEAAAVYEQLLEKYEKKRPISSIRYRLGKIHFEKGEIQKASTIWAPLKEEKNDFWYKLSQERLKGSEWSENYKKYIRRIPAMENSEVVR